MLRSRRSEHHEASASLPKASRGPSLADHPRQRRGADPERDGDRRDPEDVRSRITTSGGSNEIVLLEWTCAGYFQAAALVIIALDLWLGLARSQYLYGPSSKDDLGIISHLGTHPAIETYCTAVNVHHPLVIISTVYLIFRAAFGVVYSIEQWLVVVLFGSHYFCHQQNDFQHVYLSFILLLVHAIADHSRSRASADTRSRLAETVLRLVSIVYMWTSVTKLDTRWLSGETLYSISSPWFRAQVTVASDVLAVAEVVIWSTMAVMTIVTELSLALALLFVHRCAWLRAIVTIVGVSLHAGMAQAGLDIGLFSELMIGVYLLTLPATVVSFIQTYIVYPVSSAFGYTESSLLSLKQVLVPITDTRLKNALFAIAPAIATYWILCQLLPAKVSVNYRFDADVSANMAIASRITYIVAAPLCLTVAGFIMHTRATTQQRTSRSVIASILPVIIILWLLPRYTNVMRDYHTNAVQNYQHFRPHGAKQPDFKKIIQAYNVALSIDPKHADSYAERGFYYDAIGKSGQSSLDYRRAVSLDPWNLKGLAGMINYYAKHGKRYQGRARETVTSPQSPMCDIGTRLCTASRRVDEQICQRKDCEYLKKFNGYARQVCTFWKNKYKMCET